jgi:DNA-binding XRE family transcriptional regulator
MRTLTENNQTFVLVPLADFERMTSNNEDIGDIAAFDNAMERNEGAFPIALLDAIEAGENPIKAFREHRGIKQAKLAHMTNISPAYLSQLENGAREGSVKIVKAIAMALNVPMDLLA